MRQKTFLVTGATGDTGRHATAVLLERGHRVRALVQHADARSDALTQRGAEVVLGDLLDFAAVQHALQGVGGAYFVFPLLACGCSLSQEKRRVCLPRTNQALPVRLFSRQRA